MTISKLRNPVSSARASTSTKTPATEKAATSTAAKPWDSTGTPAASSTFEPSTPRGQKLSEGRRVLGGVADDSVGRRAKGGVADDSVGRNIRGGVADDSVGRSTRGGVADDSVGRRAKGGVADDSVGRKPSGGVADDSVGRRPAGGVADDSVGRGIGKKPKTGVPDDSIGRTKKNGVPDDSIGGPDPLRDALVGPATNANFIKLRDSLYGQLENPSYMIDPSTGKPLPQAKLGARGAADYIKSQVVQDPFFQKLSSSQQASLGNVMGQLDESGMRRLGALVEQAPEVLTNKDAAGRSLISNLEDIAKQPLNSMLSGKTTKAQLLDSILLDVANPNRIDQGDAPTCTVTSMQFELVADNPSEYARLLGGLTGPSGQATMRGGGELMLGSTDADRKALDGREISQALFQTAAMEYGNGKSADFDPISGQSKDAKTGKTYAGLGPTQQTQVLRQLFGINYRTEQFYTPADGAKALEKLRGFDASKAINRPVLLDIDQGPINHAVTLEKVDAGRVYFRDPYGVLRSITEDLFPKYVVSMHRPADQFN